MVLGIYGASGLGREMLVLSSQINMIEKKWSKIVLIDDYRISEFLEYTRIYTYQEFVDHYSVKEAEVVIAVGEPAIREKLYKRVVESGYSLQSLLHPSVYIPTNTSVGSGSILCMGSFISCNVVIGDNVLVQPHVNIGHDCVIENHAVLSGFVNLAGGCVIKERAYLALSVCVKEKTTVGKDSIIGMGSVVANDIQDCMIALGNPARPMKRNDEHRVFK